MVRQRDRVTIHGVGFDPLTEEEVVRQVATALGGGTGGQILTPNVDILRRISRDAASRRHAELADLVVADGKPLVWASRLAGAPLPARVAGSDLIWSLCDSLSAAGRSVFLLGGPPGTAQRADEVLRRRFPSLTIAGHLSPPYGFDTRADQYDAVCAQVVTAAPDLVFVGLGFPKQENVIARLRPHLPRTWFMGCGAAIGFVAGVHRRAPHWMQRTGLEWTHRLVSEPQRLARRYLVHDLPFAARLLGASVGDRLRRRVPAAREAEG